MVFSSFVLTPPHSPLFSIETPYDSCRYYSSSLSSSLDDNNGSLDVSENRKRKQNKQQQKVNNMNANDHDTTLTVEEEEDHPAVDASSSMSDRMSLSNTLSSILDESDFQESNESIQEEHSKEEEEEDDDDDDDETVHQRTKDSKEGNNNGVVKNDNPTKNTHNVKKQRSKAQIKTLKFLMMQDIESLIQDKNKTAIIAAQNNIDRLERLFHKEGNDDYKPKIMQYNLLIRAHGKLGDPMQAEEILNNLEDLYQKTGEEDIRPTVISYTEVIDAYAKSNHAHSAENAERLLYLMMDRAQKDDGTLDDALAPTSITCDAVLNAWARKGTREAARRAEEILERMEYLRAMGGGGSRNVKVRPTAYSFATVIHAWARAKFGRGEASGKENAERAQFILRRMVDFQKEMETKERAMSSSSMEYSKELEVDTVIYNSVLDAWARSKDPIAGTRAEELLFEMEEIQKTGGKAAPDTITYNSVINCHANSGHINAAKAAERVLKKMEMAASTSNGRIAPNTMTYNQVLKAYSKSSLPGSAERANMILTYMLQSGNESIRPDVISFSTCLDVLAKSKEPGKAEKAYLILQKMVQLYDSTELQSIKPNEVTYNTVLNACAFSAFTDNSEKKKALSIAIRLFNEMQKSTIVRPDAVTYGMLIKCIANLVPKGTVRNNMASEIFRKCIENGLVNGLVFDEIRRALPGRVLSTLLKDSPNTQSDKIQKPLSLLELRDLPRSWRANVIEAKPKGKRKKAHIQAKTSNDNRGNDDIRIKPVMRVIVEQSWQSGRDV